MDPTVCNNCNRRFSRKFACVCHVKEGKCKGFKESPTVQRKFICDHCKKSFASKSSCADHITKRICFNNFENEKKGHPEAHILDFESLEGLFYY